MMSQDTVRSPLAELNRDLSLLYVEDGDVARDRLAAILGRRVGTVTQARDGLEGLERYRQHRPDIVVTDLRMPGLDGIEMARAIKREDPEALVIVTTAFRDSGFLMDSIDIGIDAYVLKPVDTEKLFAAIARCARIVTLRREIQRRDEEQRTLIADLQQAAAEIKTLRGILPICSTCKKIRDDKGYWTQVETYLTRHSDALFSHGLCPDCLRRLYPEYTDDILGKEPG